MVGLDHQSAPRCSARSCHIAPKAECQIPNHGTPSSRQRAAQRLQCAISNSSDYMSKIKILKPSPIIFGFLLISLPLLLKGTYATAYYMFLPCLGRRIEDKMEAKGLDAESVFLRFDTPPANKKVALSYQAWIINMKGPNMWNNSLLYQDRPSGRIKNYWLLFCFFFQVQPDEVEIQWPSKVLQQRFINKTPFRATRELLPWVPESQYVVPTLKDAVPHASEGMRR